MPRARNIKPGFFKNDQLADTSAHCRLLFIGLWTLADRDGRLEYRPRRIKGELFPYEDIDVDSEACQLQSLNFVKIYEVSGTQYLQIVNFEKHQKPHPNEKSESLPGPEDVTSDREMVRSDRASSLNDDCLQSSSLNDESDGTSAVAEDAASDRSRNAYPGDFEQAWEEYPKREGGNPKKSAFKAWKARRSAGVSAEELLAATKRYAQHCKAHGKTGTSYVKQGSTFYGPDEHYRELYSTRPPKPPDKGKSQSHGGFDDREYTSHIPDWAKQATGEMS